MSSAISKAIALCFLAVFLLVGPLLLAVAGGLALHNVRFISSSTVTDGTIVRMEVVRSRRGTYHYVPEFRFIADDGLTYMLLSNVATSKSGFKAGEHVKVLYQHGDPVHARIDSFLQMWIPTMITGFVGGAATAMTVFILVGRKKQAGRTVIHLTNA